MDEMRAYYNIMYKEDNEEYLELISYTDRQTAEQTAKAMNEEVGYHKYYVK